MIDIFLSTYDNLALHENFLDRSWLDGYMEGFRIILASPELYSHDYTQAESLYGDFLRLQNLNSRVLYIFSVALSEYKSTRSSWILLNRAKSLHARGSRSASDARDAIQTEADQFMVNTHSHPWKNIDHGEAVLALLRANSYLIVDFLRMLDSRIKLLIKLSGD
jgi:hypothetical protein